MQVDGLFVMPSDAMVTFDSILVNAFNWIEPVAVGLRVRGAETLGITRVSEETGPVRVTMMKPGCEVVSAVAARLPPVNVMVPTLAIWSGTGIVSFAELTIATTGSAGRPGWMSTVSTPPAATGSGVVVTVTGVARARLRPIALQFALMVEVWVAALAPSVPSRMMMAVLTSSAAAKRMDRLRRARETSPGTGCQTLFT